MKLSHKKNAQAICSARLCMLIVSDVLICDYVKYKTFTVLGTFPLKNPDAMEQMSITTIQTTKFLDMQYSPAYYFLPLRYKYSPQYPFLRHPESRVR
jgi:hypothetical protein